MFRDFAATFRDKVTIFERIGWKYLQAATELVQVERVE